MKFVKEHGTAKQAFLFAHSLKSDLEKIDETVSDIAKSTMGTTLKFDEKQDLIHCIPTLGKLTKSEQPSQVKYTPIKEKRAQCIVPKIDKPLTSFRLASIFKTSDTANVLGMVATEENTLLLCYFTDKHEVLVYTDNGQYVSAITMSDKPYDIVLIPGRDQYVVTLPVIRSIQNINRKSLKPGNKKQLPSEFKTYGITADKQYIYVGALNEVYVLNHEGTFQRTINPKCYIDYLLISDNNLYSCFEDKIYCHSVDKYEMVHQTQMSGGNYIGKIIKDRHGFIYVGGEESGKVHRLDKELKENMTICDDSLKKVSAICFNKNCSKLFVANERGKTIAVFSCT